MTEGNKELRERLESATERLASLRAARLVLETDERNAWAEWYKAEIAFLRVWRDS